METTQRCRYPTAPAAKDKIFEDLKMSEIVKWLQPSWIYSQKKYEIDNFALIQKIEEIRRLKVLEQNIMIFFGIFFKIFFENDNENESKEKNKKENDEKSQSQTNIMDLVMMLMDSHENADNKMKIANTKDMTCK
ncbi:hypothetical protein RFI_11718 [Reticulomyxa filosa]|uniref:Uncharacterized protein n=1 Tax=Reticulomyxa filosa TaxID=46433 RepID=X6NI95_RETFI|nr:hypothetical protein RFI_11718 [Reticulomyxa filosa]|eukprot:ETO25419.1 hypothetical protein RFI_11718 [Reticulomyxa filosa]